MPAVLPNPGSAPREPQRRDPRAVAAWCAAVTAAALGVGQLLAAQFLGIIAWRGDKQASISGIVDEAALVIWLAAAAVTLGAAAPRLLLRAVPGRRMRIALPGVAAFGALLAAPVATATAAWAQMFGGDLSQLRAVRLVAFGVVLGAVTALLAVRSRAAAWSLAAWLVVGWVLLIVASRVLPDRPPVLGHLDPGPLWSQDSRLWQARLVLIVIAAAVGGIAGVIAVTSRRWTPKPLRALTLRSTSLLSTGLGPALMVASYLVAELVVGELYAAHVTGLMLAVLATLGGAYAGAYLTRRSLTGCGTASTGSW